MLKVVLPWIVVVLCFSESRGQAVDITSLKKQKFFSERSTFRTDSVVTFSSETFYNDPSKIDEEYRYNLQIQMPLKARNLKSSYEVKDSSEFKVRHSRTSVWNWSGRPMQPYGTVEILKWKRRSVFLKVELLFTDLQSGSQHKYLGVMKFKKS